MNSLHFTVDTSSGSTLQSSPVHVQAAALRTILPALTWQVTAPQLADAIIIHFMDFCAANSDMADAQTQPCTMALYDLSKLHGLSRALAQVAQLLHDSMQALEPEEAAALAGGGGACSSGLFLDDYVYLVHLHGARLCAAHLELCLGLQHYGRLERGLRLAQIVYIDAASSQATLPLNTAAPAPPPAVELGLAGKATVLPGDENMADVMQLLEAVERVAGGNEHRLVNESALGLLRDGVAAARQGLQALQVQYQLLAPQGVSFSVSGAEQTCVVLPGGGACLDV